MLCSYHAMPAMLAMLRVVSGLIHRGWVRVKWWFGCESKVLNMIW
jgi:hypothetical protein